MQGLYTEKTTRSGSLNLINLKHLKRNTKRSEFYSQNLQTIA
jgi:hypothetical protein